MKALILNGELKEGNSIGIINKLTEEILVEKGYEVKSVLLREKQVGECIGCFGCWVKTPGICIIDDYGRSLTEAIINMDTVIYLTPVVYGGYSSELKKAVDRIIPLILPFFKKIEGEIHHKERYKNYPKIVVLGVMPEEDSEMEEIFNSLIRRNSLNWYNSFTGGTIKNALEDDIISQLKQRLIALEVGKC
ncbi:NADPH-dependent FMN reductase [Proteiniborus ethanoligenes]|uniref:NADPH-dependent FMN reductase n=1 Tax=Proteiniborus ethanoligenes TaxID=415015 RepID=A0A1H3MTY0_9FIRM|nr:NAD(P)H-dependent oxidoreductase [Proteiniborus ethanoligenes]SDY80131.1 NADPH-dependent FMN reductase [Proteiniborus ethanoligenes]